MNNYTKEDIIRLVEEEDVEFIRLQFTDLFGNLKNIAVTASQLDRVLNNKCMFDGSAIDGFARIEESDMYLYPDLSTLEIFPWRPQQGKVARMICDVYRPNGQPFEGDPRYVLKRSFEKREASSFMQPARTRDFPPGAAHMSKFLDEDEHGRQRAAHKLAGSRKYSFFEG